MLVTQNSLIGYTILNGTFGLQLAMFVASTYNLWVFHDLENATKYFSPAECS